VNIDDIKKSKNLATELDDDILNSISMQVIEGYEYDEDTRTEWKALNEKAMEMAKQTVETKNHPWPNASNVKYPLITKASIDFAARTYPEIIKNNRLAKGCVIGYDPEGVKQHKADNVSQFMSYQLLQQCEDWEEGLDISLHTLSIVGTIFKKTYWDPIKRRPVSKMCNPDKVVVDYNITSLKDARRITHIMHVYKNDIVEQIRYGNYRDVDLELIEKSEDSDSTQDPILELLEQHCYLDLDNDGYREPYIVVLHRHSGQILSIKPRFANVEIYDGKVLCIEPEHWFTDYHFIRSHDGGFYSLGFGVLLLPLNSAINTVINQILDSGTLNNLQSGFVGRGIRIKGGDVRPKMGEWKVLDSATGTDLQKNIVPLPTKEPSMVLFKMLELLIMAGKELTSSSETTSGQAPPANVPAAAWLNSVDNALKVLTAINKRYYKSLASELRKIFYINQKNLTNAMYRKVLDNPQAVVKDDFDVESFDIIPVADPSLSSATQRVAKIQAIMAMPVPNQEALTIMYLEALEVEPALIQKLMTPPQDQGPSPEQQKLMAEAALIQAQAAKIPQDLQLKANELLIQKQQADIQSKQVEALENESAARIMKMTHDMKLGTAKVGIVAAKEDHKANMKEVEVAHKLQHDTDKLMVQVAHSELSSQDSHESDALKALTDTHKANLDAKVKLEAIRAKPKEKSSDE
jgi:chaperonin GroES